METIDPVEIPASKTRSLGLLAAGAGFVLVSGGYLKWGPGTAAETFVVFVMYCGIALGAVGMLWAVYNMVRSGPVVSIGSRGIFDRRVSADWIPWSAIRSLTSATIQNNSFILLEVDPDRDGSLAILRRARWLARANAGLGFDGYAISGTALVGGFPALLAALQRFAPPAEDGPG